MHDVFLSFNPVDRRWAERVTIALREAGLTVLAERVYLDQGQPWPQGLERMLRGCQAVVVLQGPEGMDRWQQRERQAIRGRWEDDAQFQVVPVLLPGGRPSLGFLPLLTWVDLQSAADGPLSLGPIAATARRNAPSAEDQDMYRRAREALCPYRGLEAFREEDAPVFRGRERETSLLTRKLRERSAVALVGPSGVGKSSVVQAGLVPRLRAGGDGQVWEVVTLKPGDRPLHALAAVAIVLFGFLAAVMSGRAQSAREKAEEAMEAATRKQQAAEKLRDEAERKVQAAQQQLRMDRAHRLLQTARQVLRTDPKLAALLAAEALGGPAGDGSRLEGCQTLLREALEQIGQVRMLPEVWLPTGSRADLLQASRDGASLAARVGDEVRVWSITRDGPMSTPVVLGRNVPVPGHASASDGRVGDYDLSPDGRRLAIRRPFDVLLFSLEQGRLTSSSAVSCPPGTRDFRDAYLSPNGRWLVTKTWDQPEQTGLWSTDTGRPFSSAAFGANDVMRCWEFSRDGKWLATLSDDQKVRVWSAETGTLRTSPEFVFAHAESLLDFSPDGCWLATRDANRTVRVWPLASGGQEVKPVAPSGSCSEVDSIEFSPDGNRFLAKCTDGTLRLHLVESHVWRLALAVRHATNWAVEFSSDGKWFLGHEAGLGCRVWSLASTPFSTEPALLKGQERRAFSPDSSWLATSSRTSVSVWPLTTLAWYAQSVQLPCPRGTGKLTFSPDGTWLVAETTGPVRLWRLGGGPPAGPGLEVPGSGGNDPVQFSPDGRWLHCRGPGPDRIWSLASGVVETAPANLECGQGEGLCSPDGTWAAESDDESGILVCSLLSPARSAEPLMPGRHEGGVTAGAFSPDGRWLATGGADRTVRVWSLAWGPPVSGPVVLGGHRERLTVLAFSPSGSWLASGSTDGTVRVWPWTAAGPAGAPMVLAAHRGEVTAAAFSPDGKWLTTGGADTKARLWALSASGPVSAPIVLDPVAAKEAVTVLSFSPDGRCLIAGSRGQGVQLWSLASGRPVTLPELFERTAPRLQAAAFSSDGRWFLACDRGLSLSALSTSPVATGAVGTDCAKLGPIFGSDGLDRDDLAHWASLSAGEAPVTATKDYLVRFSRVREFLRRVITEDMGTCFTFPDRTVQALRIGFGVGASTACFSLDGRWLAADASVWDLALARGRAAKQFPTEPASLAFSPDNQWLATTDKDGTTRLWSLRADDPAEPAWILPAQTDRFLGFSPDGKWLATAHRDGSVRLWLMRWPEVLSAAAAKVGRNLTRDEWRRLVGPHDYRRTFSRLPGE
ncbi:MAG: TIR domain-containing protein [Candidatus Riflebacteria bacterium]|nr:TIR domain-containing protein [Candidatus Riflebacteria bacterium]